MKPNLVGQPIYFLKPTTRVLDNTIVAAIDSSSSSYKVYPNAQSATIPSDYNEYNWTVNDEATDLANANKVAFGVPIAASNSLGAGHILYQVFGSISFYGQGACTLYPFFGRAISNTVVSSTTTTENELASDYIVLPQHMSVGANNSIKYSTCMTQILKRLSNESTYPYFFGYVIENKSGAAVQLDNLRCSLSIRAYTDEIREFQPTR